MVEKTKGIIAVVRGVNKNVIEVSDTGSKYFERVIFFVRPECSGTAEDKIKNRAGEYIIRAEKIRYSPANSKSARKEKNKKRNIAKSIVAYSLIFLFGFTVSAAVFLLLK